MHSGGNAKWLLRFAEHVLPNLLCGYDKADPECQALVDPLVNVCRTLAALLNPRPRYLGSTSDNVWYCVSAPAKGDAKRRKRQVELLACCTEANRWTSEIRTNEAWTEMLQEYAEACVADDKYGTAYDKFETKVGLFMKKIIESKDGEVAAIGMAESEYALIIEEYRNNITWYQEYFRHGATTELDEYIENLLDWWTQAHGEASLEQHQDIIAVAKLCGASKLKEQVSSKIRDQKTTEALGTMEEALSKDLSVASHVNEVLECLRKVEHLQKPEALLAKLTNDCYPAIPAHVSKLLGSRDCTQSQLDKLFQVPAQLLQDKEFVSWQSKDSSLMTKEMDSFKKIADAVVGLKTKAVQLLEAYNESGIETSKEQLFSLSKAVESANSLRKRRTKFESNSIWQVPANQLYEYIGTLVDGKDGKDGLTLSVVSFVEELLQGSMANVKHTNEELAAIGSGGKDQSKSWKTALGKNAKQETVKKTFEEHLKHCDATNIERLLGTLNKDSLDNAFA